ncbi:hypothetical protein Ddye_018044 [Dipteronia dyeriana]|uniref:Uncharacterized protein n=1 Tax=Dipteronia dyeriana TaxID=168575 RepID=A0AAD9U9T5_9ROSI|nr:hypothetical protein Ddye_018044 [Dipteronia dyeriana]
MMEGIIIDMGDEVKDKIVFDQLIFLGLHCLLSLTSFCKGSLTIEFPSLRQVFVMKCLKMASFSQGALSTPKLQRPKLIEMDVLPQDSNDDDDDDDEWFLESEGDEDSDYDDELILESKEGEEDGWNWEGDLNTSIQQFFEHRNAKNSE